jgi:hypothetical protein
MKVSLPDGTGCNLTHFRKSSVSSSILNLKKKLVGAQVPTLIVPAALVSDTRTACKPLVCRKPDHLTLPNMAFDNEGSATRDGCQKQENFRFSAMTAEVQVVAQTCY